MWKLKNSPLPSLLELSALGLRWLSLIPPGAQQSLGYYSTTGGTPYSTTELNGCLGIPDFTVDSKGKR